MNGPNNVQLLCIADPQRALAASLAEGNIKHFQYALNWGADPNVRDDRTGFTVFEQTCQKEGSAEFILECLKNGANVQMQNANGKYPIHFATSSLDPNNILVLLNNSTVNIDVAYQDRTSLHMLFEVIDQNNWSNVFLCIKVLLKNGADFNIPNDDNRTPLGVFVKNSKSWKTKSEFWRKEILEHCLQHTSVDVDSFRKGELRNKIVEYFPDTIIPSYIMETNLVVLMSMLKSHKDAKFDVAYKQYKDKHKHDTSAWKQDLKELVKAAVHSGTLASVKKLVEDDFVFDSDSELPELLTRCCSYGNYDVLNYLLSKLGHTETDIKQINKEPLLSLVIKEINILKNKDKCPFFKCLNCLLGDQRIEIDKADQKGFSALHYAVKYKVDAAVELLLRNSAYIGKQNMFKELPIYEMSPEVLENYLDSCLTANEKRPGDDAYEINIDYSCLVPPEYKKNYSGNKTIATNCFADEMLPIMYMSKSSDLKHLLKHPVISSFVLIKWLRLSLYFYINFLICTLFFLSFTWYVVGCYGQDDVDRFLKETLRWLSLVGATYMALRELGQMMLHRKMYFKSLENWMEIVLILASYTVLLKEDFESEMRQVISAIVILLSAVEFTLLVGTLPVLSISTHMVMLKTVSKNFLKSLVLYSIILISFAFCFYTLFNVRTPKNDQDASSTAAEKSANEEEEEEDKFNTFSDIRTSLLKTMVMLTGEFEAANIKFDTNSTSYLIFVLFIFFVAIVIFNLMNGLAVSDTAAIKAEAELIGLSQKVDVISKYENALKTTDINGYLTKAIFNLFPSTFLQLFPEYLPLHYVIVMPNQSNIILIPRPSSNVLSASRTDVESHIELLPLDKQPEEKIKLTIGCCVLPSFSRMDGKILKYAKEILHSRNRKNQSMEKDQLYEIKLAKMERDIGKILAYLSNSNSK
ncbi:transient receptor potential cation channel protein painless isoform X2 [Ochlerotatus camptorhynchus]|uniref:transient receptor potential cation channel protein painless isoform X2 n=1 Tax=Ochlerotatus camptorhynchus TaxID=644619 RepID=UPI0031D228AB